MESAGIHDTRLRAWFNRLGGWKTLVLTVVWVTLFVGSLPGMYRECAWDSPVVKAIGAVLAAGMGATAAVVLLNIVWHA
jgi:hypothetical protein